MFERHTDNKDIFEEGYKSLQKGILLFGGSLVVLAILIFVFPALIGYMFAGAAILAVGWKVWRFKKHISDSEEGPKPFKASFRTEGPHYSHRRIFVVMK
jgi:hypothetical protein